MSRIPSRTGDTIPSLNGGGAPKSPSVPERVGRLATNQNKAPHPRGVNERQYAVSAVAKGFPNGGRPKYTDEEREAIWALACAGLGHKKIGQALRGEAGESPLPYILEIPDSSVLSILNTLRRRRGTPTANIPPDADLDKITEAAKRKLMGVVNKQVELVWKELSNKNKALSPGEHATLDRQLKTLQDIQLRNAQHNLKMKALREAIDKPEKDPRDVSQHEKMDPAIKALVEARKRDERDAAQSPAGATQEDPDGSTGADRQPEQQAQEGARPAQDGLPQPD